jgi:DtxR family Mn-dependent transcriptional regulator
MALSDRAEEILETLWTQIVERKKDMCDASLLKDDDGLKELSESGFIKVKNSNVKLTRKGKEEAKSCIRRHRLAERLFTDVLDLKGNLVHDTSCKFEHFLNKGLDENICTLLGHPRSCPHGRPIPEGNCCKDLKRMPQKMNVPLPELGLHKKARVVFLQTHNREMLKKIIAMGALPKTNITLLQKYPSYVFKIGKSQFAVDNDLASCIYVSQTAAR